MTQTQQTRLKKELADVVESAVREHLRSTRGAADFGPMAKLSRPQQNVVRLDAPGAYNLGTGPFTLEISVRGRVR